MKKPAAASLKKESVKKGSLKKENPKNQLNSTNLKKLGELSLKEKIAAASEENSDEEQAAMAVFGSVSRTLSKEDRLKKRERWLGQKEADQKWTEKELELHIASGRVQWRERPDTWDVYEYRDTKEFKKSSVGKNTSTWQYGQEYEMEAEDEDE
eukprot:s2141_g2.t1